MDNKIQKTDNHSKKKLKWVKEGLVLRVISQDYKGGLFYNKKIIVKTIVNEYELLAIPYDPNNLNDQ